MKWPHISLYNVDSKPYYHIPSLLGLSPYLCLRLQYHQCWLPYRSLASRSVLVFHTCRHTRHSRADGPFARNFDHLTMLTTVQRRTIEAMDSVTRDRWRGNTGSCQRFAYGRGGVGTPRRSGTGRLWAGLAGHPCRELTNLALSRQTALRQRRSDTTIWLRAITPAGP